MDRCYKIIVSALILSCVLIPKESSLAAHRMIGLYAYENTKKEHIDEPKGAQIESLSQQKKEVLNITNEELLLLSKLITGEARGESYEGQIAVAAVVINRVKDSRFPNTIRDVIYQKNAFSVVNDGSINMQPTESAYKAAQEALYGNDPTDDAVYFWNPDIATCNWIKTLDPYLRIGNHVFAK